MERLRRRALLAGCGTAVAGLAGCQGVTGGGGDESNGSGGESDRLRLETVAVSEFSGDETVVTPAGEPALLDFFATWCAPCKPQMAELRTVRSRFPDLHMLSITWEGDTEAVAEFWREYEGTWPVATDPDVETGPAFGVERLPTLLVIDADGAEVWRDVGLSSAETIIEELEAAL